MITLVNKDSKYKVQAWLLIISFLALPVGFVTNFVVAGILAVIFSIMLCYNLFIVVFKSKGYVTFSITLELYNFLNRCFKTENYVVGLYAVATFALLVTAAFNSILGVYLNIVLDLYNK